MIVYIGMGTSLLYVFYTGHRWVTIGLLFAPFILIFVTTSVAMVLFGDGETTWFRFGIIHITEESFYRGLHLGLRSIVFGLFGLIFALTTRPVLLFYSLMQQFKLHPKYAYSFMAAIRMLPIIAEEFQVLRQALKIRGINYEKGIKGVYQRIRLYAIPLLAQSIRRAHRIAVAMEAKQFSQSEQGRTYYYPLTYSFYDLLFFVIVSGLLVCSLYLAISFPIFPVVNVR